MSRKSFYFYNLDLIRFVAFFGVFISHLPIISNSKFTTFLLYNGGNLGVEVFFVLSGFLITTILLYEKIGTNEISLFKFYLRRIFRIFPLYFLVVLIILIIGFFGKEFSSSITDYIKYYASFLGNFDRIVNDTSTTKAFIGSGVLWSIGIEEQFYLIVPIIVLFFKKIKQIFYFLLSIYIFTLLYKAFVIMTYTDYSLAFRVLNFSPFSAFDSISFGCLIAYISVQRPVFVKKFADFFNITKILILILVFICLLFVQFKISNIYFDEFIAKQIYIVIFSIIILFVSFNKNMSLKKSNRFIKIVNYLGKISFGLYMFHTIVIHFLIDFISNNIILFVCSFTISTILAWLSYEYLETPFLKLKQRYNTVETKKEQ